MTPTPQRNEEEGPWISTRQVCTICGNEHVSVHPLNMLRNGECPNCHNFTCEDIDEQLSMRTLWRQYNRHAEWICDRVQTLSFECGTEEICQG